MWTERFWLRLQTLLHREDVTQRLDDEIQFHLDQQISENIAAGMNPEEARHAALRTFGNATVLKEETQDTWAWISLEQFVRDVSYAVRALRRTPAFSILAILVIALGIGATTALFAIVRSVLLEPLPFKGPSQLIRLYEHTDEKFTYNEVAGGVFTEWKKQSHGFSDLAIVLSWPEYNLSGANGQLPERVRVAQCSWNLFSTLGVEPALGRSFTAADDQLSANASVVLSWGLWKRRFGGEAAVLNQTIDLDAKPYTVIGVMPRWFAYPEQSVQLWTPVYHEQPARRWQSLDGHMFVAIGRLKTGVTQTEATTELSVIVRRLHDEHLDNPFISKAAHSRTLLEDVVGDVKTPLYVLLAATACLLLIACLNVASLLVARGAARRRERAIRTALGGSRWRLLAEHLTESWILAAAGGAGGLLMAYGVIRWFISTRQDMSRVGAIHMDGTVVAFAVGLIFLCAVFAATTSWVSIRSDQVIPSLQESSRSNSAGRGHARLRKWLLSMEVGFTVVLLIGAGLLLKSYERLRSSDLGCLTNNVLTLRIALPDAAYSQPAQRLNFYERLVDRAKSLPGVEAVGLASNVPGQCYCGDNGFAIAEHPPLPMGQNQYAVVRWADPGYFATLGIPLLRGQSFDANQRLDQSTKVVVSESFARLYFPTENPLGKHLLTLGDKPYEIIGVVGDTRFLIAKAPEPTMYFPLYSGTENAATLAIRSRRDVTRLALPIQQIVQQLDVELPVSDILTMDQIIGKSTLDAGFDATLVLAFAVLSLMLAAVGLFGVLSYVIGQRTAEIGIRIALGAQRSEVLRLMLSEGLRPASAGLVFGLAGGAAAAKMIRDLLYGVQPLDAGVFAGVTIILLGVGTAACLLPAWRASRLDPMQALRNE